MTTDNASYIIYAPSLDLVFSVDVIHNVADLDRATREAALVLRPGGRLCPVIDSERVIRYTLVWGRRR